MGIGEILTVVFIVLKILKVIDWNWFFVLLPEIIVVLLYIVLIIAKLRMR